MPARLPARLCRNRHGTNYVFRFSIPKDIRRFAGRSEVRLSLTTEVRHQAVISSHLLAASLPQLFMELRRMAEKEDSAPDLQFYRQWLEQVQLNARLRSTIERLENELTDHQVQIQRLRQEAAGKVERDHAERVARQTFSLGKLRGREALEEALVFPWPAEKTKLFSELGTAFIDSFSYRADGGRKKPPAAKTQEKYKADIQLFIYVMGDVRIGGVDRELAGAYFKVLKRLPPNINKIAKYRGKTIEQILAIKAEPQSENTISGKIGVLSAMFKWAIEDKRRWGIESNPFAGYAQADASKKTRRPFTEAELLLLLSHETFARREFRTTYGYWLIPLALFTGARLGELAQLDLKDFVTVDGIDCIDINDTEAEEAESQATRAKRLKTRNAKRLVPIHPELVRLGLLRYVDQMRARRQVHLFPELSRERRDGPSHAASNWFQKFRARVGLTEKQTTVFHSFRHLFITTLLDGNVSPHMVAPIVGHETELLITGQVYWNKKDATKRKPTVDAFQVSLQVLALLPCVEDVRLPLVPKG